MKEKCPRCGFTAGDRVKMQSALVRVGSVEPIGVVYGVIKSWPHVSCHIVEWDDSPLVTGLPNSNVRLDP